MLNDLQLELDVSWAVLGEVYSKQECVSKFGLRLRRIRSNLENKEKFEKSVDYIPLGAAFKAADADLLKLLIDPLYGNRPEVGFRELMQNSIDAIHELREFYKKGINGCIERWPEITKNDPSIDIVISICRKTENNVLPVEDWEYWVEVRDRGIGMNADIICNYFLNAGASFRNSEFWRANYLDADRMSVIPRSGRFGVGVLAAFLLGNKIKVITKNTNSDYGISFVASIEDDTIELKKVERDFIGTEIYIKTNKNVFNKADSTPKCN